MLSLPSLLAFAHLIGLALGVGAATVKLALLFRCSADAAFVPVYAKVVRPVTTQIIIGQILMTLSGLGWLLVGHPFTPRLVVKLVLVAAVWVLGPMIDNAVEPGFLRLAPAAGESPSPAFVRIQRRYLTLEVLATGLFYLIIVIWVLV
jgi:hypothetical protein